MASQRLANRPPTDTEALNAALRSIGFTRKQREALRMILAGHLRNEIRDQLGQYVSDETHALLSDKLSPKLHALLMQKYERASRRLIAERAAKQADWWPDYRALTAEIERLKRILRERCIHDPMSLGSSPFATPKRAA